MRAGQRLSSAVPGDWAEAAACQGKAALMFPDLHDTAAVDAARAVCKGCPVRQPCLDFAIANREKEGMWGGKTWPQRKHLLLGASA